MLTIGGIILVLTLLTQAIFVGPHEAPKPVPSKHEVDARWENVV